MADAAPLPASELVALAEQARARTLHLIADLNDEQLLGPRLAIVNPPLWEVGHVAWFQERWILRHWSGEAPLLAHGDTLYNSAEVQHDTRWDLTLPSREGTLDYMSRVLERVKSRLDAAEPGPEGRYFALLATFHELMHTEALTYTRQTHGYSPPRFSEASESAGPASGSNPAAGDVTIPGGQFQLGATPDAAFVFDNEKWAHAVTVQPFSMARTPVTQEELAAFVEDNGYRRRELWSPAGWRWRKQADASHPIYWKRGSDNGWLRRHFDKWVPLEPRLPAIHVNWYEAEAYCQWAGRRLPTEAEWEMAAAAMRTADGRSLCETKLPFPWGDDPPSPERANLDWHTMGPISVDALPAGDSAFGCRQMVGNVWEWTTTDFGPYPGFAPDPYKEYSQPWFYDHKVLRGGCWTTHSSLIRNTWRNFYQPHRRDVFAGFRTCAR